MYTRGIRICRSLLTIASATHVRSPCVCVPLHSKQGETIIRTSNVHKGWDLRVDGCGSHPDDGQSRPKPGATFWEKLFSWATFLENCLVGPHFTNISLVGPHFGKQIWWGHILAKKFWWGHSLAEKLWWGHILAFAHRLVQSARVGSISSKLCKQCWSSETY